MLGLTHPLAAELAERLVRIAPPGLERVFYSDSGSTATEIALKMAFQYWRSRASRSGAPTSACATRTTATRSGPCRSAGIDLFHECYGPLLFDAHHVTPGDASELECILDFHDGEIAAVIVEPLVQGAAGIRVQPPGFLRRVRELCDTHDVLMIVDEVATGFGRTGTMFACEQERVAPDLMCVAKGLTGGYLPLAATLATERIYEGFLGAHEDFRTFFHGHTYTGNPLACAAAIANLDAFETEGTLLKLQPKIRLLGELLAEVAQHARGRRGALPRVHGRHRPRRARPGAPPRATASRSRRASAARSSGRSATRSS